MRCTSDAQNSTVSELARNRVLDIPVRIVIDKRSSLIEDEDLAVVAERTSEREAVDGSARALLDLVFDPSKE